MAGQLPADRRWRWAVASKIGTSHQRTGTRKQDAYKVVQLGPHAFCAIVADGAGSASFGGQGASLVCRHLIDCLKGWSAHHPDLPDDETLLCWIDDLRDRLDRAAAAREIRRRQFASTLVMLFVLGDQVLTAQIGDSAMVGRRNGGWEALCWPDSGEFASTTYFVTDDPTVRLHTSRRALEHDAFALFSDGLEAVALEQASGQPFPRFFDPMIKPVDQAAGAGRLRSLSEMLGQWLQSPTLCDRTDDDKTLALISCV